MALDQQEPTPPIGDQRQRGTVGVGHQASGLAVVSLRGEHDISTQPDVTEALEQAAAHSDVLVDLSECSFMDSTVVAALIKAAQAAHARDERLVLVIPANQKNITRVAEITHLGSILTVHTSRSTALASLGQAGE
jgi:anti-sigma B factor antagonist